MSNIEDRYLTGSTCAQPKNIARAADSIVKSNKVKPADVVQGKLPELVALVRSTETPITTADLIKRIDGLNLNHRAAVNNLLTSTNGVQRKKEQRTVHGRQTNAIVWSAEE